MCSAHPAPECYTAGKGQGRASMVLHCVLINVPTDPDAGPPRGGYIERRGGWDENWGPTVL